MLTSHPSAGTQKRDLHVGGLGASVSGPLAAVTDHAVNDHDTVWDVADTWFEKVRDAVRDADDYVHANPWQALAVVAVVGLTAGYLLSRRTLNPRT
jgi:hypothetical protein